MHLENFNCGAGVPTLNQNHLHKQKILLPPLPTQTRIVAILSAYDDLIEVNNQRIKLLEETARELYKEWFVRMRFPSYQDAKFLKGVPEGWEMVAMGKVVDFYIGGASNMKSRELKEGDIVFETAGGSEGQPLGRTCFITQELLASYEDKIMAASFCKQIRTETIPSLYLYYFFNYLYDTGMIESFQIQSTGISNYQFEPFLKYQQILLPTKDLMEAFHEKTIIIQKRIVLLGQQNTQLRQVRDRLLPRLISGKLQV